MTPTEQMLERLVAFPTISRQSNLAMMHYIRDYLSGFGIDATLIPNESGDRTNLHAVLGPPEIPGIMLSGHSDVVPVEGQEWTVDPFTMTQREDRCYGRGTTDMKGFIASVLALVPEASRRSLQRPLHLAFSYDEEIGCVGVRGMLDTLATAPHKPAFCIIGEPTRMEPGVGHKGKVGAICRCSGVEAHSALANKGLNAIYLATSMIEAVRALQHKVIETTQHDQHYDVPYTTLHVGTISGGTALNIVPGDCEFRFEIRHLAGDDPEELLDELRESARRIVEDCRDSFPDADIQIEVFNRYPGLGTSPEEDVVQFVQSLLDTERFVKLAFGTEGGLFQQKLGLPTVVCGPGSMDQGHKPDEFISRSELARCDRFLARLLDRITADPPA